MVAYDCLDGAFMRRILRQKKKNKNNNNERLSLYKYYWENDPFIELQVESYSVTTSAGAK